MKIKKYQKGGVSRKKYIMKDGKKIEVSMNDITLGNKSSEEKSNFIKKYGTEKEILDNVLLMVETELCRSSII